MIQSFDIENFRCFERMSLKDLRTINIVVGDNGSGKTALLEALLLAAHAHPQAVTFIRLVRNRSLPQGDVTWSQNLFRSLWEDLFFNFKDSKAIVAKFTDSSKGEFVVRVSYLEPTTTPAFSMADSIPPLVFTRSRPDGTKSTTALLKIDEHGNPVFEGAREPSFAIYILTSTYSFSEHDMINYFSTLSRLNRERDVIEAMQTDFPDISNISILTDAGVSGFFVTSKSLESKKIPLTLVSSGAARYLNMLIAISLFQDGVVLIDEIENGLYWKKMPNIWATLRELCARRRVQLFVTTHSNECLQSLIGAVQGHEDDFSLIRTVGRNGERTVKQFDGKTLLAALKQHGEIR